MSVASLHVHFTSSSLSRNGERTRQAISGGSRQQVWCGAFQRHASQAPTPQATPAQAYDGMMFREALKAGWYDLHKARDTYRAHCAEEGLHADLALRFAEARARCHAPCNLRGSPTHAWGMHACRHPSGPT